MSPRQNTPKDPAAPSSTSLQSKSHLASLTSLLNERRSVRGFTDQTIEPELLQQIFGQAQQAPSNCNTQPWKTYVASGETCVTLSQKLLASITSGIPASPDFVYFDKFTGEYRQRQIACAQKLYDNMGVARNDKPARMAAMLRNYEFFGAPHVAIIGMPKQFGLINAIDIGIYLQTLMLVMNAHGIACCAQGALAFYPQDIKQALNIPDDMGVVVGLSFGYEDPEVPANNTRTTRAPLVDTVFFKH